MNSKFKITIPKPCHENWNTMTPKEKGRFCSSCAKTVVDFTKKSTTEIENYLIENKTQKTCGHFYKKQLDSITIEIPQVTFQQQLSFQKLFVLALFFVMGTTLFSCKYADGKKQKIENVIVKDSIKIIEEDVGLIIPTKKTTDSLKSKEDSIITLGKIEPPLNITTTKGITICKTEQKKDALIDITTVGDIEEVLIDGDIELTEEGEIELQETLGFIIIEKIPRFKEAEDLSKKEARKDFDKRMKMFVQNNFDLNTTKNLGLNKSKYRIYTQFEIDEIGNTTNVKVRAPHPKLEKEVIKMLKKLPQFIPGKQAGKIVKTKYSLPITFMVE